MPRIFLMIGAVLFLFLFGGIPYIATGSDAFEKMSDREKHKVMDKIATRMADYFVSEKNLELVSIDINAENRAMALFLRDRDEAVYGLSDRAVQNQFSTFNKALCEEMRPTDLYKSGVRLTIEFQKPDGSQLETLTVSKTDCVA